MKVYIYSTEFIYMFRQILKLKNVLLVEKFSYEYMYMCLK
jgi:hypothetical protein